MTVPTKHEKAVSIARNGFFVFFKFYDYTAREGSGKCWVGISTSPPTLPNSLARVRWVMSCVTVNLP